MGRNFRAARILQTAREFAGVQLHVQRGRAGAESRPNPPPPAWVKAVEQVPPSEILTRPIPHQHTPIDPRARRPRKLFQPKKLVYPEDELRRTFFRDHPWELARPRNIFELDGMDARYADWSTGVRQPGMQLSGECVVQRQLWLMENQGLTKEKAYDIARKEFYALRHREDIERRIAVEEASVVGGYFGKTYIQVGMQLEDMQYERWKSWATDEISRIQALDADTTGAAPVEEETPMPGDMAATPETVPA
ncbi:hypothetical protein OQA88_5037 [Cercophora sp. LCS_1]